MCVCVYISECVHMCVCMWRPDISLGCHSSAAIHLAFVIQDFPLRSGAHWLGCAATLEVQGSAPTSSNSGPKARVSPLLTERFPRLLRYSLWQNKYTSVFVCGDV